jgi:hypothetical protein
MSHSPNNIRVIKLKTGETIVARVESTGLSYHLNHKITVTDPVAMLIHPHAYPEGDLGSQVFSLMPWAPATEIGPCDISTDLIVSIMNLAPTVWPRYEHFVDYLRERGKAQREWYEQDKAIFELLKDVNNGAPVLFYEGKDREMLKEESTVTEERFHD